MAVPTKLQTHCEGCPRPLRPAEFNPDYNPKTNCHIGPVTATSSHKLHAWRYAVAMGCMHSVRGAARHQQPRTTRGVHGGHGISSCQRRHTCVSKTYDATRLQKAIPTRHKSAVETAGTRQAHQVCGRVLDGAKSRYCRAHRAIACSCMSSRASPSPVDGAVAGATSSLGCCAHCFRGTVPGCTPSSDTQRGAPPLLTSMATSPAAKSCGACSWRTTCCRHATLLSTCSHAARAQMADLRSTCQCGDCDVLAGVPVSTDRSHASVRRHT